MAGPDIDAEVIAITARLWQQLGLLDDVSLELNSIGSLAARAEYKSALVSYLTQYVDQLDENSQRRLATNPLRILDSKSASTQELLKAAPSLADYLDDDSRQHFEQLTTLLDTVGIKYRVNPRLVRGLDYYGKTVFEWVTDRLGAQGTICAGGRYDGLVEQLGGKPVAGVGFAMGIERLCLLLEVTGNIPAQANADPDIYFVVAGQLAQGQAFKLAEQLRSDLPELRLQLNCGGGSFKSQFKKADKSGATIALVLGDDEAEQGNINVKWLRNEQQPQQTIAWQKLQQLLQQEFNFIKNQAGE
jgi:histidyl-tRNA synthetase